MILSKIYYLYHNNQYRRGYGRESCKFSKFFNNKHIRNLQKTEFIFSFIEFSALFD